MNIQQLPFRKHGTRGYAIPFEFTLPEYLTVEQWIVPKGTVVQLVTTTNFGYVVVPEGTKDQRGFVMPRRMFRY